MSNVLDDPDLNQGSKKDVRRVNVNAVIPIYASTKQQQQRIDSGMSNCVIKLIQFQPAWALHTLLRFKGLVYECECQQLPYSMGEVLPVLIDGHYLLSESDALAHLQGESLCSTGTGNTGATSSSNYPSVDDLSTPNGSGGLDATGLSLLSGACSHGALCAWIEAELARPLHKLQSECKDFRRSQWMAAGGAWNPAAWFFFIERVIRRNLLRPLRHIWSSLWNKWGGNILEHEHTETPTPSASALSIELPGPGPFPDLGNEGESLGIQQRLRRAYRGLDVRLADGKGHLLPDTNSEKSAAEALLFGHVLNAMCCPTAQHIDDIRSYKHIMAFTKDISRRYFQDNNEQDATLAWSWYEATCETLSSPFVSADVRSLLQPRVYPRHQKLLSCISAAENDTADTIWCTVRSVGFAHDSNIVRFLKWMSIIPMNAYSEESTEVVQSEKRVFSDVTPFGHVILGFAGFSFIGYAAMCGGWRGMPTKFRVPEMQVLV
jgi:hypothetical protein